LIAEKVAIITSQDVLRWFLAMPFISNLGARDKKSEEVCIYPGKALAISSVFSENIRHYKKFP
jgi:hypothetical protein